MWLTFLEVVPRFEGRSQLRTFLFGILRRKAAETHRRNARAAVADEDAVATAPSDHDTEAMLATVALRRALSDCVDALPEKERRVVDRKLLDDEDSVGIGRALGITANYLGVLLHRARAHLRDCMGGHTPKARRAHHD